MHRAPVNFERPHLEGLEERLFEPSGPDSRLATINISPQAPRSSSETLFKRQRSSYVILFTGDEP